MICRSLSGCFELRYAAAVVLWCMFILINVFAAIIPYMVG
jgi:hypothetical protein